MGDPGVVECVHDVVESLLEMGPAIDVSRDDDFVGQDFGGRSCAFAGQRQGPAMLPGRDAREADEQHRDVDGPDPLGNGSDRGDRRVVATEVDGREACTASI
jgi:hypothetical protein